MTLETQQHEGNNVRKRIVECPYCGADVSDTRLRAHLPCERVDPV